MLLGCSIQVATAAEAYEYVGQWKESPYSHGIAVDSAGNVYVAYSFFSSLAHEFLGPPSVSKTTSTGAFIMNWKVPYEGHWPYDNFPDELAIDSAGNVYVSDYNNQWVQKFTSSGTFITKWGTVGTGDGQFNHPEGIAIDSASNVYVVDAGNNRTQKFTSTGAFITKWGTGGPGDGQFTYPYSIAVDRAGNVYVVDRGNNRVQKFRLDGTFVTTWGTMGSGNGQFQGPRGITVDGDGNIYVTDAGNNRIQKFTSNGRFITTWGTVGSGKGLLKNPLGIAVDGAGTVYVVDSENQRVLKFAKIPAPTAGFGVNTERGAAPLAVKFTDTSTGAPTSWSWTFGDGGTSTEQSRVHVYSKKGVYTVSLQIVNPWGVDVETRSGAVTVVKRDDQPVASFAWTEPAVAGVPVWFTDTSTGEITRWDWKIGQSAYSIQNPVHTFSTPGEYKVTLRVRGSKG